MENISSLGSLDCFGNGGGSLLPKSFRTSFSAPLKNTLVLERGVGGPTFTRATTATVTDFEGLVKTVKSGEARFEGARRVENLVTYSEDFSNAVWTNSSPSGSATANTITFTGSGNDYRLRNSANVLVTGHTYTMRVEVMSGTKTGKVLIHLLDDSHKKFTINLSSSWKTYSYTWTAGNVVTTYRIGFDNSSVYGGDDLPGSIYARNFQIEDVTGQANQNPSEYVSTNVLSAPYHGANVDGVKYFTTQNGNTVASNVVTEATGAAIPDATLHGYLAEGARTNLETYSEDMSNWSVFRVTVGTDVSVSPSGATTADSLIETSGSGTHAITRNFSVTSGTVYTLSAYIKPSGRTWVRIDGGLLLSPYANFNLSGSGSIGTITATSATITNVGGGWYRCTVTSTASGTGSTAFEIYAETGDEGYSYVGTNSLTALYVWGAQLETGAFASSYIPTTSASVTRNADGLTYPTAGNLTDAQGSIYLEARYISNYLATGLISVLFDNGWSSSNNRFQIRAAGAPGIGTMTALFGNGAGLITSTGKALTTDSIKIGAKWGSAGGVLFEDGTKYNVVGATAIISGTSLKVGSSIGSQEAFATIRNVKIWKKALSDAKLISLTQ